MVARRAAACQGSRPLSARDIIRWLDGLSGLPDLERVRFPAGIDDRAAGSNRRAELGSELVEHLEILRGAEPAAAADDDRRVLELGTARLLLLAAQHTR